MMERTTSSSPRDATTADSAESNSLLVDGQCFIASTEFLPPSFVQGIAANTQVWMEAQGLRVPSDRLYQTCLSYFNDPSCDELVSQMDEAGIAQSVLMLPDFTYAIRTGGLTISEMMDRHKAVLDRHPGRFYVMAGVDPRWGRDGVDLFEKAVTTHGFHGMKLYPPCGYSPSDDALSPFYEICEARKLPVSVHIGGTAAALQLDLAYPRLIDRAARQFPGVKFILSHASTCYTEECVMLCTARPNVFLDVSAFAAQPISRLNAIFEYGISHKIIFATDWPSFRGQGRQQGFVAAMRREGGPLGRMRGFEAQRFLGGTILSLLPPGAVSSRHHGAGSSPSLDSGTDLAATVVPTFGSSAVVAAR